VIALEQELLNYATLNKNIFLNKFNDKIIALNLALYNEELISSLHIRNFKPGKSCHGFHDQVNLDLELTVGVFRK